MDGAYANDEQFARRVTSDIIAAMPNLELVRKDDVSSFRKIAIGTWKTAYDPSVYGTMTIHMDEAVKYMHRFREKTGRRLTISHMMAKVAAEALKTMPDANSILRWNRVYLRKRIGVFFQVVMTDEGEGKVDLSGATLYDVENMSLLQICDEFEKKVSLVRDRKDPALEKTRGTFKSIPYFMLNWVLRMISFFSFTLNLDLRWAGIPSDPFGSIMITNVGSLGLDVAYVPLVPYSRVPILLAVGAVKDEPVARDGQVVVGKIMRINATFDHRFIDGFHAAQMSRIVRKWLEDPFEHFDKLPSEEAKLPSESAAAAPKKEERQQ
jgi:pyruvate dehydrogenase E2 component (dihydrolipoamide acetyltransferase)